MKIIYKIVIVLLILKSSVVSANFNLGFESLKISNTLTRVDYNSSIFGIEQSNNFAKLEKNSANYNFGKISANIANKISQDKNQKELDGYSEYLLLIKNGEEVVKKDTKEELDLSIDKKERLNILKNEALIILDKSEKSLSYIQEKMKNQKEAFKKIEKEKKQNEKDFFNATKERNEQLSADKYQATLINKRDMLEIETDFKKNKILEKEFFRVIPKLKEKIKSFDNIENNGFCEIN